MSSYQTTQCCHRRISFLTVSSAISLLLVSFICHAEPYLALESGQECLSCHTNITGGGKRPPTGTAFAQLTWPATTVPEEYWDGRIIDQLYIGGQLRANGNYTSVPNQGNEFEFDLEAARLFFELPLLKNRITFYLDQQFAPGSESREAFALLFFRDRSIYVKAGKFFLPFGWRLEDDTEFIRQVTGINFDSPDEGIEIGFDHGPNSVRFSATNGAGGGAETDTGKQYSFLYSYVRTIWRVGASANFNDAGSNEKTMVGGFAGIKTGPVVWLGEVDYVSDESLGPSGRDQIVGFAEANWRFRQGHNLKLSYGAFDPDDDVDEDEQNRYSIVYEYTPLGFAQFRVGARIRDGIPQDDLQNSDFYFVQLNAFF